MTATLSPTPGRSPLDEPEPLQSNRLSNVAHVGVGIAALAIGTVVTLLLGGFQWGWIVVVSAIAYVGLIYAVARVVEDRRQATDRLATAVVTMAFLLVVLPLISVVWTVIVEGSGRFDWQFLTSTMRLTPEDLAAQNDGAEVGGGYHAIIGTLIVTGIATVISVPLGLFTAIYLVEYGRGKLAKGITAMVDVMTGIPSIVAGLFAYALFVLFFGPGTRTGLAGGVALAVLMTPVVVRSAEEMLKLVPNELRVASYALGVP
jgi:phosphate transport system permease protein